MAIPYVDPVKVASRRLMASIDRARTVAGQPAIVAIARTRAPSAAPEALPEADPPALPSETAPVVPTAPTNETSEDIPDSLMRRAEDTVAVAAIIKDTESAFDPSEGIQHLSLRRLASGMNLSEIFGALDDGDACAALDKYLERRDSQLAIIRELDASAKPVPPPPKEVPTAAEPVPNPARIEDLLEDRVRTAVHAVLDVPTLHRIKKEVETHRIRYHGIAQHREAIKLYEWDAAKERLYACEQALMALETSVDVALTEMRLQDKPIPAAMVSGLRQHIDEAQDADKTLRKLERAFKEKGDELERELNEMAREANVLKEARLRLTTILAAAGPLKLPIPEDVHAHVRDVEDLYRDTDGIVHRLTSDVQANLVVPPAITRFLSTLEAHRTRLREIAAVSETARPMQPEAQKRPPAANARAVNLVKTVAADVAPAKSRRDEHLRLLGLTVFYLVRMTLDPNQTVSLKKAFDSLVSVQLAIPDERQAFERAMQQIADAFQVRTMKFCTVWCLRSAFEKEAERACASTSLTWEQKMLITKFIADL